MEGERGLFNPSAAYSVKFLIPSKEVGKIIGKGGETIKSLQAEFGVHINVPKGQEPSTEVIVGGPAKQNVDAALAKISNILGHSVGQAASGAVAQVAQKFDLSTSQPIREALFFPDASNVAYEKFYNYLRSATKSIDIAVYTLSDNRIEELLLLAHKAGVKIRIVSDNDTVANTGSGIVSLARAGIPARLDGIASSGAPLRESTKGASSLMHHKFAILDGKCVLSGSFNWTSSASSQNAENIMATNEVFFVQAFSSEFEKLWAKFASFKI